MGNKSLKCNSYLNKLHKCRKPAWHKYTQILAKSPCSQLCSDGKAESLWNHASCIHQSLVVIMLVPVPGITSSYHIYPLFFFPPWPKPSDSIDKQIVNQDKTSPGHMIRQLREYWLKWLNQNDCVWFVVLSDYWCNMSSLNINILRTVCRRDSIWKDWKTIM